MFGLKNKAVEFFEQKLEFTTGPVELKGMLDRGEAVTVVDVRAPEDYAKGHIPGAVNLSREKWDRPEGVSHEHENVVYCYSQQCHLAAKAALELARHDIKVVELEGGFDTWKGHGFPVESPQ